MLTLSAKITYSEAKCSYLTFTDNNDELDTELQYGEGANPLREDILIFAYGEKIELDNDPTPLTVNNPSPSTATSWNVYNVKDGYIKVYLLGCKQWNADDEFVVDKIVYYAGKFYICIDTSTNNNPSTSSAYFTEIGTTLLDYYKDGGDENEFLYFGEVDYVDMCRGRRYIGILSDSVAQKRLSSRLSDADMVYFSHAYSILDGIGASRNAQKYMQAESNSRLLEKYYTVNGVCSVC
jgi:hypothetical protein